MKSVLQIINEEIQSFFESSYDGQGAADSLFAKATSSTKPNDDNIKTKAELQRQIQKPFITIRNITDIYRNPRSLENFDKDVRAIADKDGNLYVVQKNANLTHHQIGMLMDIDVWNDKILRLVRVGNEDVFVLSDAVMPKEIINEILEKLKQKNPSLDFFNVTLEKYKYKKVMREGSYSGQGVADVAYEKFLNRPSDAADLKAKAQLQIQQQKPYGYVKTTKGAVPVFKNPKNLTNFGKDVRAISDYDGNIYVAQNDADLSHGQLGVNIGLHKNSQMIYELPNDFLLLQRQGLKNSFVLSDASENKLETNPEIILDMLDIVRYKHPQFRFIPERHQDED